MDHADLIERLKKGSYDYSLTSQDIDAAAAALRELVAERDAWKKTAERYEAELIARKDLLKKAALREDVK